MDDARAARIPPQQSRIHRATVVVGLTLVASALLTTAGAMDAAVAIADRATPLHFTEDPCAGARTEPNGTITVVWTTTVATDEDVVAVGRDDQYGRVIPASAGRTHAASFGGMLPGDTIHLRMESRRLATGEIIHSGDCVVRVAGDDVAPPVVTATITALGARGVTVVVNANEPVRVLLAVLARDPDGVIHEPGDVEVTAPMDERMEHAIAIGGLAATTDYLLRLDAVDAIGNATTVTPDLAFRTLRSE